MTKPAFEFVNLLPDILVNKAGRNSGESCIEKLSCKYVVIQQNGVRYFVLGNVAEYPYHANLVNHFCSLRQIACAWERKPDLVTVYDNETKVLGGGWMDIQPGDYSLRVYGSSTAYGPFPKRETGAFIESEPFFHQFKVTLDQTHSTRTL